MHIHIYYEIYKYMRLKHKRFAAVILPKVGSSNSTTGYFFAVNDFSSIQDSFLLLIFGSGGGFGIAAAAFFAASLFSNSLRIFWQSVIRFGSEVLRIDSGRSEHGFKPRFGRSHFSTNSEFKSCSVGFGVPLDAHGCSAKIDLVR